jgi:2-polyprenyl-3-methyl-5-hydroxy-6-metoxy-1,4-benzoquinol methylase
LGPHASQAQHDDPKHNLFTLARYKFCTRMLIGKKRLLEVGCGDGFGLDIVLHELKPTVLTGVDFDQQVVQSNRQRFAQYPNVRFLDLDVTEEAVPDTYDGAWCIDVIEHIQPKCERAFLDNIVNCLDEHAIFVIGTPNATAQRYACEGSRVSHINLKDAQSLRRLVAERFFNVFLFSMNDEVVHTGFYPMAHYLFAMGVGPR